MNFDEIVQSAKRAVDENSEEPVFNQPERIRLISLAWSMIDQADLLRQLIDKEKTRVELSTIPTLMEDSKLIRDLRNIMDHFPGQSNNYYAKKKAMPPSHGVIAFNLISKQLFESFDSKPIKMDDVDNYKVALIFSTGIHKDLNLQSDPFPNHHFSDYVSNFSMQAFGIVISLGALAYKTSMFCTQYSQLLYQECLKIAFERAQFEPSFDKAMEPSLVPRTIIVDCKKH
jgi:hypothetical protein